jgi:hypothetical protein
VKRLLHVSVVVGVALGSLIGLTAQSRNQVLVFRKYVLMDEQGFQMEALHLLVPKDWQLRGGVTWNFRSFPPEFHVALVATSPDGRSAAEQFPDESFFWSQNRMLQQSYASSGKRILAPMPAARFLKEIWARQHRGYTSGLTVLETQSLPDLAERTREIFQYHMTLFGQISPFQFPFQLRADAARVKFQYQQNGGPVIEEATATVTYFTYTLFSVYGQVQNVAWVPYVFSFRAPAREMNEKVRLFKVIADSRQDNPAWQLNCTRLSATVTREQLRQQDAVFARMRQIHRTEQETSDLIVNSYYQRSATYDRIFDNYSQAVRGVQAYTDPGTNTRVDLPNGYADAWTNGWDYVMSNDPGYDPNVGSTQTWRRLNPQK